MKYALVVHVNKEAFDQVDVANAKAAGMAYGEALRAAAIFVARGRSGVAASGHYGIGPKPKTPGGQRVVRLRLSHSSKCVH